MDNEQIITEHGKWNDRLEMLGYDIVALISGGEKESVNDLIKHFQQEDTVHYLMDKYKEKMFIIHEKCTYNIAD